MEKFICEKLKNNSKYEYILYSTSYESTVNDKESLLKALRKIKFFKGYVIIDLLLSKGNNHNRFIELYIDNEAIKSLRIKKDVDIDIKNASLKFYYKNKVLLNEKTSVFYI